MKTLKVVLLLALAVFAIFAIRAATMQELLPPFLTPAPTDQSVATYPEDLRKYLETH